MSTWCVLLAAGRSERFGSNKLLCDFAGKPMVCHALACMQALPAHRRCAVTGDARLAQLASAYGCDVIRNDQPERGQAHSIHLGVDAMQGMDAVLLLVGDQPRLTKESLSRLLEAFCASDKGIACLCDQTHRGNPAVFSARYFPALLALLGDRGAKGIIKAHEDDLVVVPCLNSSELGDADTPQALEQLLKK